MTRRATLILVAAVTLGALARFATLDLQSLHHDEALTASRVLQPGLWDMLNQVVDGERNPPLYFVLAWIWSQIFGTGEIGLRSLSALLGTFMIPAAFFAGRELTSARAGVVAATLVALNPLLVWYSQEARAYVLMALLITLSLAFLARSLNQPSRTNLTLWAVTCALALSTHYFAIFLVAPQALWLLYHSSANRRTVAACGAIVATVLALVPLAAAQQGEDRREGFRDLSLTGRVAEIALDYSSSEDPDPLSGSSRVDAVQVIVGVGGGLLIVGGLALALTMGSHRERRACLLVAGIGLFGVGIPALAAAVGFDFLKPRNVMAGVVPLLLGAAIGFATRERPRLGLGGAVALCALYSGVIVAVNSTAEMQREDWRGVAELIGDPTGPRLLAVPQNGDDPLIYYLDAERFVGPTAKDGITTRQVVAVSTTGAITPPAGFQIVRQDRLPPLFTVWTLHADRSKQLYPGDVAKTLKERSTFLVDSG